MDAIEAIYLLRLLGLSLMVNDKRLDASPAELLDADTRWLTARSHQGFNKMLRWLQRESEWI